MTDKELIDFALTKSNATPKFKLKYFVGGAQLTPYATLRQWLMELRAREESLDFNSFIDESGFCKICNSCLTTKIYISLHIFILL